MTVPPTTPQEQPWLPITITALGPVVLAHVNQTDESDISFLARRAGDSRRFTATERNQYSGVRAHWQNVAGAQRREVIIDEADNLKTLRNTYASEAGARTWLIKQARHSLDDSGYITAIKCETAPD